MTKDQTYTSGALTAGVTLSEDFSEVLLNTSHVWSSWNALEILMDFTTLLLVLFEE